MKSSDPLGCTQLNLNRAVFSLNQRSRTNLAIETTADWTSGRCCVDPLRPPLLPTVTHPLIEGGLKSYSATVTWRTPPWREWECSGPFLLGLERSLRQPHAPHQVAESGGGADGGPG